MSAVVAKLHRKASSRGFDALRMIFEEYRRALAAEVHYEALKHESSAALARDGIGRGEVARCVFDEFYGRRATG